jgi:carboxymethylenebutenolidase
MNAPMTAGTVEFPGRDGGPIEAYAAQVADVTPRGGVVVIHHLPGYDRETKEYARRLADAGWDAVVPNLYCRIAPGASYDDAAAAARAQGGVPDDEVMGYIAAAAAWLRSLPTSNGRVASLGHCSGGRQSFLAAATLPLDAAVVCYGGLITGDPPPSLTSMVPVIDRASDIGCPLLGLWGNDDKFPTPDQVDEIERALADNGKSYEFHRYDGAGHAFFSPDRPSYRPEAAVDGWRRIEAFLASGLGG